MNHLTTLLANIDRAVFDNQDTLIGGGVFVPAELRWSANGIRRLQASNERLEHDQKLLLEALKQVLDYLLSDNAKTMDEAVQVAKRANAAYRHVTGT